MGKVQYEVKTGRVFKQREVWTWNSRTRLWESNKGGIAHFVSAIRYNPWENPNIRVKRIPGPGMDNSRKKRKARKAMPPVVVPCPTEQELFLAFHPLFAPQLW